MPYPFISLNSLLTNSSYSLVSEEGPSVTQVEGIEIAGPKQVHIIGLTAVNPTGHGINSDDSSAITARIENCVLAFCGKSGIRSGPSSGFQIENCVIHGNNGN
jgi:hypothetical protein